jgi:hypothetical protein
VHSLSGGGSALVKPWLHCAGKSWIKVVGAKRGNEPCLNDERALGIPR